MPPDIDPSVLTPHELSKMNKKDLARHLTALQEMYTVRGRKYDKAKSIIRKSKQATQVKRTSTTLIPKPRGHRSRDFTIIDEMGANGKVELTKTEYNNLLNSIRIAVLSSGFDMSLPLKDQETVEVAKVIAYVQEEYPFIGKYRNAWPVHMLIRQFMSNHRYQQKNSNTDNDTDKQTQDAGPSTTATATDPDDDDGNGGGGEDEGQSDVCLTDIECD